MSKTRKDREGNIRLRADGRWEVRVTIGIDYATGEERRISRYAKTQEEAIKLLHELSFIRDHTPNNFQSVTVSEWLPFCLETYMRPTLKQSTYLSYESYIRVHLNAKHHDKTELNVLEYLMYQTGNIIRLLITLKQAEPTPDN